MLYKEIVKKISVSAEKKLKQKKYLKEGLFEVVDQGQSLVGGYSNDSNLIVKCDLPVIVFGDHTKCVKFIDFPFVAGADGVKVLRAKEGVDSKYLYYYTLLLTKKMVDKGYARHYQFLEKMEVDVPSLPEQKRIVNKIEELFSELDSAVETLKKTKEQLAVYRQSVLKEAFEGNFTEIWRKRNKVQKDWKATSIQELVKGEKNSLKAGPFGSALKKEFYVPSGYKVYGQEQVIAGDETIGDYYINQAKYEELISCKIAPNDVLISLVGTVGKVLVLSPKCEEGIINPRLIKVSLDLSKMLPYFFKYYFESGYLKSLYKQKVHGETMDVLNMGMIKELPFPSCSIEEQRETLKEIERRFSLCDKIEKTVNDALAQAEAMRQSILKKAFEGEL